MPMDSPLTPALPPPPPFPPPDVVNRLCARPALHGNEEDEGEEEEQEQEENHNYNHHQSCVNSQLMVDRVTLANAPYSVMRSNPLRLPGL